MQFNPNMIGNNSIKNYNSFLNKEMQALNINFDKQGMVDFDNVLQQEMQQRSSLPQGPIINTGIQMNVGLENMGVSPLERIEPTVQQAVSQNTGRRSDVENMANTFAKAFSNGLNSVNDSQNAAYNAAETFASGGDISVHDVMLASQKANLTMQMAIQMRNRLVTAYNELRNTNV